LLDDLESEHRRIGSESELQAIGAWGGTMLDIEEELLTVAAEIEIGIAPSVQFRRSPQRLSATFMGGALAGMVHESNRGVTVTLQRAQISEERGDLTSHILIDPVQAHERVEDRELRLKVGDGGPECLLKKTPRLVFLSSRLPEKPRTCSGVIDEARS
jgi:hypothetical protein